MGQSHSKRNFPRGSKRKKKLQLFRQNPQQDEPYVQVIGNPEYLDWKKHIVVETQARPASSSSTATKGAVEEEKEKQRQALIKEIAIKQTQMPIKITPSIYISDSKGVCNLDKLNELGITHVLNVGGDEAGWLPPTAYAERGIDYKLIDAVDEPTYPMLRNHWEECYNYLQKVKSGKCVVHCQAGMNRSGLIVAAWYMVSQRKNVLETVLHCRTCRGNWLLHSNYGFQKQLVALARDEGLLGPAPGEPGCIVKL